MKNFLQIFLILAFVCSSFGQTITVDPNTSLQTWIGAEATAEAGQSWNLPGATYQYPSTSFANYSANLQNAMVALGIWRLRVELRLADENSDTFDSAGNTAAANDDGNPATTNLAGFHFERLTQTMDSLVIPYRTKLFNETGQRLYINLNVVDFRSTGFHAEDTPAEYAEFIYVYVNKFYTTYHFLPDAIEAILEPDTSSNSNWNATKLANNIVAAKARLDAGGYTGITWIAPSTTDGTVAATWISNMKSANASVTPAISEYSYHRYVNPNNTQLASLQSVAAADGKGMGMLELIGVGYQTLYDDLKTGNNTSFQQYTLTFPATGSTDNGSQYFLVNTSTWAVTQGSRTKQLAQYFKYLRHGAVFKGVTNSNASYVGNPARNTNGKYVCPIWANGSNLVTISGLPADTYTITYALDNGTTGSFSNQTITGGQNVTFTPPSAGVFTIASSTFDSFPTTKYFFDPPLRSLRLVPNPLGGEFVE